MAEKEGKENTVFVSRVLENDRVKLIPFDVGAKHHEVFYLGCKPFPEIFKYIPAFPFDSSQHLLDSWYNPFFATKPNELLWLVVDKTRQQETASPLQYIDGEGALAGCMGFINSSVAHAKTEIGFVMVFPPFQRTHVATNAVGLLMHYALDLPLATPELKEPTFEGAVPLVGGLGLRRCQWQADMRNEPSKRAALRMGMKFECALRWDRVMRPGKGDNEKPTRAGDPLGLPARDTFMASVGWDEWEGTDDQPSVRQKVDELMARRN